MNRDRINNWLTFVSIAGLTAFTLWLAFGGCLAATNRPTVSDSPGASLEDIRGLLVDNSTNTNDAWAYRLLAAGTAITLVSYPLGKLVWLIVGAAKHKIGGE